MNPGTVQSRTACPDSSRTETSVVEHYVEQRTLNFQPTVVFNKTQLPKPIHKKVNSSPRRPDHFRQSFLAYFRNYTLGFHFLTEAGQQQKSPGQPFLGGVKELIYQILLSLVVAANEIRDQKIGKRMLPVQRVQHRFFFNSYSKTICDRDSRCNSPSLVRGDALLTH